MAGPWYVRSTDGDNASDGLSWANAKATLAGAASAASAGDTIYVSQAHAETQASAMTVLLPGTEASPNIVLCVDDGAEPPTALATTATISTTGNSNLLLRGYGYFYGLQFQCGSSTNGPLIYCVTSTTAVQRYESCKFYIVGTGTGGRIVLGNVATAFVFFENCTFQFSNTSQAFYSMATAHIRGGATAGSAITVLMYNSSSGHNTTFSGVDLSSCASSLDICSAGEYRRLVILRDCKLPASWNGVVQATPWSHNHVALHNCDSGDTQYRLARNNAFGALTTETTLVRTGGASDGTTPISWKVVTTANADDLTGIFYSDEIHAWNDSTGSSKTVTVEILHDSATNLTDAEVWLEVMSLNTSGYPLGTWTSDRKADYLASAADQTDSSETWTTTGMSNPNTQKLSVSFTPQEKGVIVARVCVAKASKTLYVDPVLTVS